VHYDEIPRQKQEQMRAVAESPQRRLVQQQQQQLQPFSSHVKLLLLLSLMRSYSSTMEIVFRGTLLSLEVLPSRR
jgi:hypothetical protein